MLNRRLRKKSIKILSDYFYEQNKLDSFITPVSSKVFKGFAEFYLYYPLLFIKAFPDIDEEKVKKLVIAGFLCYKYVVFQDDVIDNQISTEEALKQEKLAESFMKNAMKILRELFKEDSFFWNNWEQRKKELLKSSFLDKHFNENDFSYDKYTEFAWGKSAFAILAIDSLHCLSPSDSENVYQNILESHKNFSCALQLYDDVADFTEDSNLKQFNVAIYYTQKVVTENDIIIKKQEELNKYLYLTGTSSDLLLRANEHLDKALFLVKDHDILPWKKVLKFCKRINNINIRTAETYIDRINADLLHSNIFLLQSNPIIFHSTTSIKNALKKGIEFVLSKQKSAGYWNEYLTSGGTSDVWSTGFILSIGNNLISSDIKDKAINYLSKVPNPLWGYKSNYANDIDSTNFVLLALTLNSKSVNKYIKILASLQNEDGGYSTYIKKGIPHLRKLMSMSKNQSYEGWLQSHPCVSSVTYYLFLLNGNIVNKEKILLMESYFLKIFKENMLLSYWWTSEIYTMLFLTLSYDKIQSTELRNFIRSKIHKLTSLQNLNGGFGDKFLKESPLYTSMMLIIMLVIKKSEKPGIYEDNIQRSILWLFKNQFTDGSWIQTNGMQIPSPEIINPIENDNWEVSDSGCNVRAVEFNRIFSTILCLYAIDTYANRNDL